ncbi:MAG: DUF427 domain-containing protein [Calothrix sp. MO_192.B10]|nr:DUF427 domain-containing protein [Calothrix sp. MO_192.B10]
MRPRPTPIPPNPGQESVWDYPRPARWEDINKHIKVIFNGIVIAETQRAKRVLETSHPPTYYIPAEDIKLEYLTETSRKSFCEWKGEYLYYNLRMGDKQATHAAWRYSNPTPDFVSLKDYYAFYARLMDACYVDDELVTPQPGEFYAGWITKDIVGPFKGEPGTMGW